MSTTAIVLNHKNHTIELSKKDYEAHCRFGTEQYNDVQEVRKAYPNYKVVAKKATSPETSSITFKQMKTYIEAHPDNETAAKEYDILVDAGTPYGQVKAWFLATFPEYESANSILERIAKAKKDKKDAKAEEDKAAKLIKAA